MIQTISRSNTRPLNTSDTNVNKVKIRTKNNRLYIHSNLKFKRLLDL